MDTGLNALTRQLIAEPNSVEVGERHLRLYSASANMAEFETIDGLIHAILTEPGLDIRLAAARGRTPDTNRHRTHSTAEKRRGCRAVPDYSTTSVREKIHLVQPINDPQIRQAWSLYLGRMAEHEQRKRQRTEWFDQTHFMTSLLPWPVTSLAG